MDLDNLNPALDRLNQALAQRPDVRICLWSDVALVVAECGKAAQAFDVMMRRGWYAVPLHGKTGVLIGWYIEDGKNGETFRGLPDACFMTDDPFSCLVASDKWYRENGENK